MSKPPWDIRRLVKKGDYLYAVVPEHPQATRHGYVLAHRIVAENRLGRLLARSEVVHHRNGDKKDNRWSNLEVLTPGEHNRMHRLKNRLVYLTCSGCGMEFERAWRNRPEIHGRTRAFCSRPCYWSHLRRRS